MRQHCRWGEDERYGTVCGALEYMARKIIVLTMAQSPSQLGFVVLGMRFEEFEDGD
jgi:hypothetical protein